MKKQEKKNQLDSLEFTDLQNRKEKNLEQLKTESDLNEIYLNVLTELIENPPQDSGEFNGNLSDIVYEWNENMLLLENNPNHEPKIGLLTHRLSQQRGAESICDTIQDLQSQIRELKKGAKADHKSSKSKKS